MAGIHSKDYYVELDGLDISENCSGVDITDAADEIEVTGFRATSKQYASGYRDIGATINGFWMEPDGTGVHSKFTELRNSGETVELVCGPGGNEAGSVKLVYDAKVMSFDISGSTGAAVTFSASLRLSEPTEGSFS